MIQSREGSSSELGFGDESKTESSIASQASLSPQNALSSRWCVLGIHDIYTEDMEMIEQGNISFSIYEKLRLISFGLDSVLGL